jgi:hypothetical protein
MTAGGRAFGAKAGMGMPGIGMPLLQEGGIVRRRGHGDAGTGVPALQSKRGLWGEDGHGYALPTS